MKAIITKYLGPTNTKGSRIKATDGDNSIIIPYPYGFSDDVAHLYAAKKLRHKLQWTGDLIGGHTKTGMVFVFAPK